MRRWWTALLIAGMSLPALAISADALFDQVAAVLEKAPWQARMVGRIITPNGDIQAADLIVKTLPKNEIVRIEFQKPDALADNYVVITPEKVYNYLFLTNQVIVYPRGRARIEGLGVSLSRLGELEDLGGEGIAWELVGEEQTEAGPAYHLVGRPQDPGEAGFTRVELWVLKDPPRPLAYRVLGLEGEVLADLTWHDLRRARLDVERLLEYPPDAEVIEK